MSEPAFRTLVALVGVGFAVTFCVIVVPALTWDIPGAFAAGFVNPFSSGYALDTILCGVILIIWIVHERHTRGIRHGWIAILLCLVPGVATGFALYLILRSTQLRAPAD